MKQTTTLRKFIENFQAPEEIFDVVTKEWKPRKTMMPPTDRETLKNHWKERISSDAFISCGKKDDTVYLFLNHYVVRRVGNKYFYTKNTIQTVVIKPNGVKVSQEIASSVSLILSALGFKIAEDIYNQSPVFHYKLMSPAVVRAIITGKIYSFETFYKFCASYFFKLKNCPWKLFRDFTEQGHLNLYDLRDFTPSVENSMRVYLSADLPKKRLLEDMMKYAIELDKPINFRWSDRRLKEEHQKQILAVREGELKTKKEDPINEFSLSEPKFTFLNTEKEVFLEADTMHNCLYRCYYNDMLKHKYLAFHYKSTTAEDGICVGIRYSPHINEAYIDQYYGICNTRASLEDGNAIEDFFKKHKQEFDDFFHDHIKIDLCKNEELMF